MGFTKTQLKKLNEFFEKSKSNLSGTLKSLRDKHDLIEKEIKANTKKIESEKENLDNLKQEKRKLISELHKENVKKEGAKEYIQEQIVKQL